MMLLLCLFANKSSLYHDTLTMHFFLFVHVAKVGSYLKTFFLCFGTEIAVFLQRGC